MFYRKRPVPDIVHKQNKVMRCNICGYTSSDNSMFDRCPECGAGKKEHFRSRCPGDMIGKYRVLRLIGRGGSGAVYLCDHPELKTRCAVKVLNDGKSVGVERLLREAKIAAALQRPDVVSVLDAGVENETGEPYIVMEYVDGESLSDVLRDGPLPENAVIRIAIRIASVLAAAETLGIVHRDIKPGNILLTSDGNIKLADLGIAKAGVVVSDTISEDNVLLGTPDYSSPEQLRNSGEVDSRSDIYSLGATMYHMLSGVRPFESDTVFNTIAKVLETDPPVLTGVSAGTAELVRKMMQKRPEDRVQNIHELLKKLNRCLEKRGGFQERLKTFFSSGTSRHLRRRRGVRRVKIMTPRKVLRDIFLCFAVLLCLVFTWFNFGHAYSEKRQKDNIANLENLRRKEVRHLLEECDGKDLFEFLIRQETSSRSRREIFIHLLRTPDKHGLLLQLISSNVFTSRNGEDFLSTACVSAHSDCSVVEELIRAGAELDHRDRKGRTPLMKALLAGNTSAVRLLLNYGADPCLIDNDGRNILFYLPENFEEELLDELLEADVPLNVRDRNGRTPLMVFVDRFDSPEGVKVMLAKKFNINRRAHNNESALNVAVKRRHMASAELLFNAGAKFDDKDVKAISKEYRLRNWMAEKLKRKR